MAGFTERLALVIDAKTSGATREISSLNKEISTLEKGTTKASKTASNLEGSLGGLGSAFTGLGASAVTAGVGIATALGVKSIKAANEFNDSLQRTQATLGTASSGVESFANNAAKLGLSSKNALDAANNFASLFTQLGTGQKVAADASVALTSLSADLGEYFHVSANDASDALKAGLLGQTRGLKQFNIVVDDATLKQVALANGFIKTGEALDPQSRALATYQTILNQTASIQGYYTQTGGDLSQQLETLRANFDNLEVSIGNALAPTLTRGVGALNKFSGFVNTNVIPALSLFKQAIANLPNVKTIAVKILEDVPGGGTIVHFTQNLGNAMSGLGGKTIDASKSMDTASVSMRALAHEEGGTIATSLGVSKAIYASTGAFHAIQKEFAITTQSAAQANTQLAGTVALFNAIGQATPQRADAGPGSHAPDIQVTPVLVDFQTGLDAYRAGLGSAVSGGVSDGLGSSDVKDAAQEVADYLKAVAEDRIKQLGNVFQAITGSLSLDDAKQSVDEATQKVADLKAELLGGKRATAQQQSLVGQLLQQSLTITPEEQVAIDSAQQNYEDVLARFNGTATDQTVAAPGSSFLGPTSITSSIVGPKASLAQLQVAEHQLAQAKADAVGPTKELQDAQQKLDDMRQRQKDLPKEIADAERDLTRAQVSLVDAQRAQIDNGNAIIDQGPEFLQQYRDIATQAGLTGGAIDKLTQSYIAAARAGAASQGLVDVFGNGTKFATPSDANAILSYISGINGGGPIQKFAGGGYVGGPAGSPQLIMAHGGELVLNKAQQGGRGGFNVTVNAGWGADGQEIGRQIITIIKDQMRRGNSFN